MLKLSIQDHEGRSTIIPLSDGELSIGRDEANSICLTDRNVSRQHARITTRGKNVWIENVAATYGTRFNSLLLREKAEVKPGDVVMVGDYSLELLSDEVKRDNALVDPVATPGKPASAPPAPKGKSGSSDTAIVDLAQMASLMTDERPAASSTIMEAAQPRLVVESENLRGLELRVSKTPIVIGRTRESADLVIDHKSISKEHARLTRQGDGSWLVLDLGSANGIKVNGEPFAKCAISSGDRLELGHVALRFLAPGAKAPALAGESKGGRGGAGMLIAVVAVVVVVVGAAAVFLLTRDKGKEDDGGEAPPKGSSAKDKGSNAKGGGAGDDHAGGEGAGAGNEGNSGTNEGAGSAAPVADVSESILSATKLRQSGLLDEALSVLKQAEASNAGNAKLGLEIRKVENELGRKGELAKLQEQLDSDPKGVLAKATDLRDQLEAGSSLRGEAEKLIAAAGGAIDEKKAAPRAAVGPRTAPAPREAPRSAEPRAAPQPKATPEPKAAPEPKAIPEPTAAKSGADLYKEGRDKMVGGDQDGALASFKAAASAGFGKAHGQLARIHFAKGDKGACAKHAKAYIDKYPDAGDAQAIQGLAEKCAN